jgi:hypothetical protein
MNGWQLFLSIFCGVALAQSLFLGTMMLVKDRLNRSALFYFGVMLLGLALRLIKSYFVFIPHAYPDAGIVAGGAGLWSIGPAFYLYTRHSLQSRTDRHSRDILHFLPSAMVLFATDVRYVYYLGLLHFFIYFALSLYLARTRQPGKLPRHFPVFAVCTGLILLCLMLFY